MNINPLIIASLVTMILALILRSIPNIPEPNVKIKTPIGKLLFFDGVFLYGLLSALFLLILKIIL